jgi:uracil-DNA glycosylase
LTTLHNDLETMLGSWRSMLPEKWRARFDGVELPFDAIPPLTGGAIWPANVFRALHDLDPGNVRAVIFGNDPYTKVEQATGRSFEQGDIANWKTQIRTKRVSPSLRSILQAAVLTKFPSVPRPEIVRKIEKGEIALPAPADVWPGWAKQGVLWLNCTLTFSVFKDPERAAHRNLWAPFTSRVLRILVEEAKSRPVAFVMWGGLAQELEKPIATHRDALGAANVKLVKNGHPQMVATYFAHGNPLEAINTAIGTPAVRWL